MKTVISSVVLLAAIMFFLFLHHGRAAQNVAREPLGSPEFPELRNDSTKPLTVLNARCERAFDANKPRCTATVGFDKTGGPWFGFTLVWTLRYDTGKTVKSTWHFEGRQADGIFSDHSHYQNGAVVKVGEHHQGGAIDKTGRQLDLVNVAVEVTEVNK